MTITQKDSFYAEADAALYAAGLDDAADLAHWTPILAQLFADDLQQVLQDAAERREQAREHARDRAVDRAIDELRGA